MTDPCFFGYGSLVNRHTHGYAPVARATLPGWRREWRATRIRPAAFLTAAPDPEGRIDGLVALVPGGDWAALDLREAGYERHPAAGILHDLPGGPDAAIYAIPRGDPPIEAPCPILLSYLDTVVQGFLAQFGTEGVGRFFGSTHGWHLPVADDRAAPLYPRFRTPTRHERVLCESRLAEIGADIRPVAETLLQDPGRRSA